MWAKNDISQNWKLFHVNLKTILNEFSSFTSIIYIKPLKFDDKIPKGSAFKAKLNKRTLYVYYNPFVRKQEQISYLRR